jgi:hypothetical protein
MCELDTISVHFVRLFPLKRQPFASFGVGCGLANGKVVAFVVEDLIRGEASAEFSYGGDVG